MKSGSKLARSLRGRVLGVVTALIALVVALTACGSSDSPDEPAAGGSGAAGSAEDGAFPATVTTAFGEVTIESAPQRVVALGWGDAETALALGVEPVGAADWLGFGEEADGLGPWITQGYTTAPELLGTTELDYESVAALEPDLILDTKGVGDQERYDRLSEIATTVSNPEGAAGYLTSLDDQVNLVAAALGKPAQGQGLIDQTNERFTQVASEHPEYAGKTISVAAYTGISEWTGYIPGDARVDFVTRLGFVQNPNIGQAPEGQFYVTLSTENLGRLDADLVVVIPIQRTADEVTAAPSFATIPAVRDGRVVIIDNLDVSNAISINTVQSVQYALDNVPPLLTTALG